ncbi:hypothetical protein AB0G06_16920 [Nonomuraea dietziae]|uniref:hypothetical protein n=1 Tax=Nonomuraea dietziae TaxID=65515 RepID=UPI0033C02D65
MTDALILAVYTVAACALLARPLSAAGWAERAPRLAIAMWLAACASVLAAGEAFARAFPFVPLFDVARREVARLIELRADDVAARRHPRAVSAFVAHHCHALTPL